MKHRKILALVLAVLMSALAAACGQTSAPSPSPSPSAAQSTSPSPSPSDTGITVTDMTGRVITLDKPAEKIVALTAADCEILYTVGAGNTLVGRGEYCDYPAEALAVPSVQSGYDTNIEQIIALAPDIVIMSTMAQTKEQIDSLESAGITVIATEAPTIEKVYEAITLIGAVVDKNEEAAAVIGSMKDAFKEIKTKVQTDGEKTVYFEVSPLEYGLYASGSGTFMDELATMLGLKNIFAESEGWLQVSEEQVIAKNPDYIVTTTMSFDSTQNPVDEVLNRTGWNGITAIKNGDVYNADSDAITRPGPRLADAAIELYDFVYGG